MNKILLAVLLGFMVIHFSECRPKAAQRRANEEQTIQEGDITKKTKEFIKKADEIFAGNVPNSQQIIESIEKTGEKVVSDFKELNAAITKKINDNKGPIDNSIQEVVNQLRAANKEFETKVLGPSGQKKAADLKDNLTKHFKDVAAQIDRINTNLKPEADKLKNDLLGAFDIFLNKAEEAANSLKKAISDAKAN